MIQVLDQLTIDKIAAGEVVERPASVAKELLENAIDAGANAITIEIKEGGISFIRITDNGCGIPVEEVPTAFLSHATSKIKTIEDLLSVGSLGFRGEALPSIASVSQVEIITKTADSMTGLRYEIHGGKEISKEEIGCPEGTTIIVRNLFYNTPARRKFLKTAMTEGGYINELVEQIALSRPDISFKFVMNGQNKLNTSGNGSLKDIIYNIYGKDISGNLLPIDMERDDMAIHGYIAKPYISRGNRAFEHYFVNGRYIKSPVITKAIEEAYKTFTMIHKFPFVVFNLTLDSKYLDVNVHPRKMEMRYSKGDELYQFVFSEIRHVLLQKELIPEVKKDLTKKEQKEQQREEYIRKQKERIPEPFETKRREQVYMSESFDTNRREQNMQKAVYRSLSDIQTGSDTKDSAEPVHSLSNMGRQLDLLEKEAEEERKRMLSAGQEIGQENQQQRSQLLSHTDRTNSGSESAVHENTTYAVNSSNSLNVSNNSKDSSVDEAAITLTEKPKQMDFFETGFMTEEARPKHRLIGQVFKTYWLIEYENNLFIMDQHAAHEKVNYEKFMKQYQERTIVSQQLNPPTVISVNPRQIEVLTEHKQFFEEMGFIIESFGGKEYLLRGVPMETYGIDAKDIFIDFIDSLMEDGPHIDIDLFIWRIATMACKAAIKGNTVVSFQEADALIDELLQCENPYNCPHGRPTLIAMSQYELDRKFKRIQDK